jgi:hypothetical protein
MSRRFDSVLRYQLKNMNYYRFKGDIHTISNILVASGFNRIVHGGRGDYVEFDDDQIYKTFTIPEVERYRIDSNLVYYIEYRTIDNVKIYFQKKLVDYADYKIGKYYISPKYLIEFDKITMHL